MMSLPWKIVTAPRLGALCMSEQLLGNIFVALKYFLSICSAPLKQSTQSGAAAAESGALPLVACAK